MQRFYIFQSLQNATLRVGGGEAQGGHENPESRLAISVMTELTGTEDYQPKKEECEVQVWLTIPQVAAIVRDFFQEVAPPGSVYHKFLRRLLEKRWAHMTSPICKREIFAGEGWTMERYTKV
ncbi:MAG: hypothetical protein FJZ63_04265 [Chlamydiae bacterium]|nr:hypothetical protein [Chlamydiota bacterium]